MKRGASKWFPFQTQDHRQIILKGGKARTEGISRDRGTLPSRLPLLAAIGIAENGVSLVNELEPLFRMAVVAIQIRMPTACFAPDESAVLVMTSN